MDQNFQTSFIPKKPIMEERVRSSSSSVGLFMIASIFVFFTVLLGSAGLYFYKNSLMVQLTTMKTDLNLAKNRFEPTAINKLQILDKRLNAGTEILSKHIAISPIFKAIESVTIKNIRYSKFTYSLADTNKIEVKMTGQAIGYRSVALQADLLSKNKYFIDPVFSNLSLDSKGNVLFDLSFSVDPSLVGYKQMLETSSNSSEVNQVNVEATN